MAEVIKERGFFWWFNEPATQAHSKETSVSALLTITDEGQITLEADGFLCLTHEYWDWSQPRTFPESRRVAGWLASKGEHVLLEGIERTDLSFPDEVPQRQRFGAQMCARRDTPFPDNYASDNFIELRIELTGFEEWLGLEGIAVDLEYSEADEVRVRVSYKEWKLQYPIPGGSISIESITTGAPFLLPDLPTREAQFSQHYYLVFSPNSPSDASSLRYTYTKLEELLALLVGAYNRLAWPILVNKEESFDAWNTLHFYRGAPSAQSINRYSMWISFASIRGVFGDLFRSWLSESELFGAGFYLYVASLRNPHHYSEDRFVNLVWGLEAWHRKWIGESETSEPAVKERKRGNDILGLLPEGSENRRWLGEKLAHAHEPSLRARILECLRKLPLTFGNGEIEKFAKVCADRRNDISHAGGPREDVDYGSFHLDISRLADALDHLLHMLLLHQIGVNPAVILKVITDSLVSERIGAALADAGLHVKATAEP